MTEARDTLRASEYVYAAIFCEIQLARLALAMGDLPTAVDGSHEARRRRRGRSETSGFAVEAWIHLADAITRSGDPGRALSELAEAQRLLDDDSSPARGTHRPHLGPRLDGARRSRAGRRELSSAVAVAREQRLVYEEAQALFALERLARMKGRTPRRTPRCTRHESLMQRVGEFSTGDDA